MVPNYLLLILPLCVDKDSCCDNGDLHKLEALFMNYTDPKAECSLNCAIETANQLRPNNDLHLPHQQCLYDCIGRKLEIINFRNQFVKAKYISLLKHVDLSQEARDVLEKCVDDYKGFAPEKKEFNDVVLRLEYCLFKIQQLGCMPENQNDIMECKRLQKLLEDDENQTICPTLAVGKN